MIFLKSQCLLFLIVKNYFMVTMRVFKILTIPSFAMIPFPNQDSPLPAWLVAFWNTAPLGLLVFVMLGLYFFVSGFVGFHNKFDDIITILSILRLYFFLLSFSKDFCSYGNIWVWAMLLLFVGLSLPVLIMSITSFKKRLRARP